MLAQFARNSEDIRREMTNLVQRQAREEQRHHEIVQELKERLELKERSEWNARLDRGSVRDADGVPEISETRLSGLWAVLAAANPHVLPVDELWAQAGRQVLGDWAEADRRVVEFVRRLAAQPTAGRPFNLSSAARQAGIPAATARKLLRDLVEDVVWSKR